MNTRRPPRRRFAHLPLTLAAMLLVIAITSWLALRAIERHLAVNTGRADSLAEVRGLLWKLGIAGSSIVIPLIVQFAWSTRRLRDDWERAQEGEQWLITTLRSIGDAVISTDAESRITLMNGVAQELTGWPESEARGKPLDEVLRLVHRTTREPVESPFANVLRKQAPVQLAGDTLLLSRDGTERVIADSGAPIRDAGGNVNGVVLVFRDITGHDLAEAALRASQEMFHLITEHVSDLIAVVDLEGRRLYNSASTDRARGAGMPYLSSTFDDVHPDDRPRIEALFAEIVRTGTGQSVEYRCVSLDGRVIHVESVANVIHNNRRQPDKILIVSRDITARKAAEDAIAGTLQRLDRQNATLSELAHHPALLGNDLDAAFRVLTEFAARALQLQRASIWFYNHDQSAMQCAALFIEGEGAQRSGIELRATDYPNYFLALAEGRCIPAHDARTDPRTSEFTAGYLTPLHIHSMLDAPIRSAGQMIGVICHEHTGAAREWTLDEQNFAGSMADLIALCLEVWQRREAEAEVRDARDNLEIKVAARTRDLEDANVRLKELDRLKSQFLATMSHELRTPLNSIIGFTGILRQGLAGPLNPEQLKQLGMVHFSARHLLALINDLLDLSRIESGRMEVHSERFALRGVVDEVLQSLEPLAAQKKLALTATLADPALELTSDRKKCFQILLNLANNAVKFTEQGSVTITACVASGEVTIAVADTGIGIKPESLAHLFEAFRQVDGSARRVYEGTGLGLYLCRQLTTLLGGRIWAESDFGAGSRFTFILPVEPPTPHTA